MKMAQLINFEVDVDNEENDNGKEVSDDSHLDSLKSFIFDKEEVNDIEQTLKEEYKKGWEDIEDFDEISNLCEISEEELEIDDFKNVKEKFENFSETLFPKTKYKNIENNRLITPLLLAISFDKAGKTNVLNFVSAILKNSKKYRFKLD